MTEQTDSNFNQNTFQRPTHILLAEMRDLHIAMKDLCTQFNILAERMERCAASINEVDKSVSRKLFRDYRNAGVEIGRYIKFADGVDTGAIFHVIDMDAEGFWIKLMPDGQEYHLKLLPNRDRIPFIRSYPATSTYIQRCLRKDFGSVEFNAAMAEAERLENTPAAQGTSEPGEQEAMILRLEEAGSGQDGENADDTAVFGQSWKPREGKGGNK